MAMRSTLLIGLALATGGTGCFATFTIPIEEVPSLVPGRAAHAEDGSKVRVEEVTSVEVVAWPSESFGTRGHGADVPESSSTSFHVDGPIEVDATAARIRIKGPERSVEIDRKQLRALRVSRDSADAEVGAACGIALAAVAVAGVATGIALTSSHWSLGPL